MPVVKEVPEGCVFDRVREVADGSRGEVERFGGDDWGLN